jgi:hypothetical protein
MMWNTPETFTTAASVWKLDLLYAGLSQTKQQVSFSTCKNKGLTETEKLHLRGLLCGHSPAEMASKLYKKAQGVEVELCKTIYRYVEELTRHPRNSIDNWRNVVRWLEDAGYRRQDDDIVSSQTDLDWGNAPAATNFYGRTQEISILKQWIVDDHCSLIVSVYFGNSIGHKAIIRHDKAS